MWTKKKESVNSKPDHLKLNSQRSKKKNPKLVKKAYRTYRIPLKQTIGTSLVVQRLRLCACTAGGKGLISGWGTKIPHAWPKKPHQTIYALWGYWERRKRKGQKVYFKKIMTENIQNLGKEMGI